MDRRTPNTFRDLTEIAALVTGAECLAWFLRPTLLVAFHVGPLPALELLLPALLVAPLILWRLRLALHPSPAHQPVESTASHLASNEGLPEGSELLRARTADLLHAKETAEANLREIQSLRNAIDSQAIVSEADLAGRITRVNDRFCEISGYSRAELVGQNHRIVGSGLHPRSFWQEVWRSIAKGAPWRGEICNRRKNGAIYWVDAIIYPFLKPDGSVEKYVSIRFDITARKVAEQRIVESEHRLRAVFDTEPECVKVLDLDGFLRDMNPAGLRMLEVDSVDEARQRGLQSFVRPEYREPYRALHEAGGRGQAGSLVFEIVGARGARRWLDSHVVPLRGADGNISGILGVTRDVTEQIQAQLELARQESLLQEVGAVAGVGGWEYQVQTQELFWTRQTYRIHDLAEDHVPTVEEAVGYYAPEARPVLEAALHHSLATGAPFDLELPLITARGRHIWVRAAGRAEINQGKVARLYGGFQDITSQVLQRSAIREQAERMDLTVRSANLGTWDWNITSGAVKFNDVIQTMLGYEAGEWAPNVDQWKQLVHPDDLPEVMRSIDDHLADRAVEYQSEHRLRRKDGTWAWIQDRGRVTERDAQGRPLRAMGVHIDITAARIAAEALREARIQAEVANRAKSEFLANMSHEIRTPLTAVLGFADLLREEGLSAGAGRFEMIDTIRNAGQHLLAIINDILDLSKIEADKLQVERVDTPLIQVLHEVTRLVGPRAAAKGVKLTAQLENPVPERILADPTRLRQILMNLAGNAVKFTPAGAITIRVRTAEVGGRPQLNIDVCDTGAGIPPEHTGRLFNPFAQADTSVTRKHGGTGLGLTISRRLASLMRGDVVLVDSAPGRGSTFRLQLPLEAMPGAALVDSLDAVRVDAPEPGPMPTIFLRGRILLAEDGPDNQRLVSFHLRKAGATVAVADNGRIALELIEKNSANGTPFDLLLTDMQMPEIDGYSLTRTLRERGSPLAIVALTAHAMADDRQRCLAAGCDDYVSKPISKQLLLEACARWMGVPHPAAHPATSSA